MILCHLIFNLERPFQFRIVGPPRTTEEMWPCDWFYLAKYCYWKKAE